MKQISAKKSSAPAKTGAWDTLIVKKAGNGFTIQSCCDYNGGKMPPDEQPMIFTEPGAALDHLESYMGKREHAAHEAKEEKGEKEA